MNEEHNVFLIGFPKGTNNITKIDEEQVGSFVYNSGENFNIIPKNILVSDTQNSLYKNTHLPSFCAFKILCIDDAYLLLYFCNFSNLSLLFILKFAKTDIILKF